MVKIRQKMVNVVFECPHIVNIAHSLRLPGPLLRQRRTEQHVQPCYFCNPPWSTVHSTLNFTTLFVQLYSVVPFSLSAVDNQVTVEYIYYREKIPQMRNTLRYRLLFSFLSFHFSDQCGVLAQCAE